MKPKNHIAQKPLPAMWEPEKESVKRRSLKTEARIARELGGRTTPGSGNQGWPSGKGDIAHPKFMVECKETEGSRIGVNPKVLRKLFQESAAVGKDPVLVLTALGMPEPIPKDWVCVPLEVFKAIFKEAYGGGK